MRSIFSPFSTNKKTVVNLDSDSFEDSLNNNKDAVLIDVRTHAEHVDVRIPNSRLIDLYTPDFKQKIEELDKTKHYYLYCRSGNRSYHASLAMIQMGFENVYNLAPGIIGWNGKVEQD
jgi:rhodanese-related sulfurtransferase